MIAALLLGLAPLEAITFDSRPGKAFVIARQAAERMHWKLEYDPVTRLAQLNGKPMPVDLPKLFDGSLLIEAGEISYRVGAKRVLVDLTKQRITAWQGKIVTMNTAISSGRRLKDTPPGKYRAGKKERMHISSIYGSKMPYSVHLQGNYFVHGSEQTSFGPGSHGCVRLPMYNDAAQWFVEWVSAGTPITVQGKRPMPYTK